MPRSAPHDRVRSLDDREGGIALLLAPDHVGQAIADVTHLATSVGASVRRIDVRPGPTAIEAELRFVDRNDRTLPPPARDAIVRGAAELVDALVAG